MGEPLPEPRIDIAPIGLDGTVLMQFNQDFVAPEILDQSLYRKVFGMEIESGLDGTSVSGGFGNQKKSRSRLLAE